MSLAPLLFFRNIRSTDSGQKAKKVKKKHSHSSPKSKVNVTSGSMSVASVVNDAELWKNK